MEASILCQLLLSLSEVPHTPCQLPTMFYHMVRQFPHSHFCSNWRRRTSNWNLSIGLSSYFRRLLRLGDGQQFQLHEWELEEEEETKIKHVSEITNTRRNKYFEEITAEIFAVEQNRHMGRKRHGNIVVWQSIPTFKNPKFIRVLSSATPAKICSISTILDDCIFFALSPPVLRFWASAASAYEFILCRVRTGHPGRPAGWLAGRPAAWGPLKKFKKLCGMLL